LTCGSRSIRTYRLIFHPDWIERDPQVKDQLKAVE
jgi:hypothetical protein